VLCSAIFIEHLRPVTVTPFCVYVFWTVFQGGRYISGA